MGQNTQPLLGEGESTKKGRVTCIRIVKQNYSGKRRSDVTRFEFSWRRKEGEREWEAKLLEATTTNGNLLKRANSI
jgi:hypothetical protein